MKPKPPIHSLGVDSLLAVELRNWFAKEIGVVIATFEIFSGMGGGGYGYVAYCTQHIDSEKLNSVMTRAREHVGRAAILLVLPR
jgi:hypothetical protein